MSSEVESAPVESDSQLPAFLSAEQLPALKLYQHVAPEQNSAVALCYESYRRSLDQAEEERWYKFKAFNVARRIYRKAMPPLSGQQNIGDFIACVTHGLLLGVFTPEETTRLLYAAQVAQSAAKRRSASEDAL
jgi:hypothetical protein